MSNNTYIDVYEQLIDEDPGSVDHFEDQQENNQLDLFAQIEDQAYEELALDQKGKYSQSGGSLRTQEKRPLSGKLVKAY